MKPLPNIKRSPILDRMYWVIEDKLLAGAYAGRPDSVAHAERLDGLVRMGICTFINLMEEDELDPRGRPFVPYQDQVLEIARRAGRTASCLRFPIVDQHITTVSHMDEILDAIDQSLKKDRPVYVHCFGGIGRTGTVICCWLLRHGYASDHNVFEVLKQLRQADKQRSDREAPENATQRQFVLDWYKHSQESSDNSARISPFSRSLNPGGSSYEKSRASQAASLKRDWFTQLTGFSESTPEAVRQSLSVSDGRLTSRANGSVYTCGQLETVSLDELRGRVGTIRSSGGASLKLSELVGDVRQLHAETASAGALFQVASQFNLLEMVGPSVTPEQGVGIYEHDATQGPACAIACGAGTIYRNYFVELDGQVGQTSKKQIDCLDRIGDLLGNSNGQLWKMENGYALPTDTGLAQIEKRLRTMAANELDQLRASLKIGLQIDTQVTIDGCSHLVTQAYCSAMPVAYSGLAHRLWEPFARLILEAAYEATLAASVLNARRTGNKQVHLTLLGGGAFGNDEQWILDAIKRACLLYEGHDLDVQIVSYRQSKPAVKELCDAFRDQQPSSASSASPVGIPNHYCPGCGEPQDAFLRYPWYICHSCVLEATDYDGKPVLFQNAGLTGGLCWKYADEPEGDWKECLSVICLIRSRPVIVQEAKFGGIVAQPYDCTIHEDDGCVDLTKPSGTSNQFV